MLQAAFRLTALVWLAGIFLAAVVPAQGQSAEFAVSGPGPEPTALVRSVKVAPPTQSASVEIITTRPMIPAISVLENPPRLVIDLPKALVVSAQQIVSHNQPIRQVRVHQFQKNPPAVRVVVDLAKLSGYSWDEAGNRLMVRLRPVGQATPAAAATPVSKPTAEVSPRASAVVLASDRSVLPPPARGGADKGSERNESELNAAQIVGSVSGSSVSAGRDATILPLARGGEVRVCPGTTISVTASQNSRDVMLGMNTGALEAHYRSQAAADSVLTPDFRIAPAGPGRFDYAISTDSRGDTCVRALPGNTVSATVSELMGAGTYHVRPSEQIVFHGGNLAALGTAMPADCGCPTAAVTVLRAAAVEGRTVAANQPQSGGDISNSSGSTVTASLPPAKANDVHVQVDAPLVFRAAEATPATPQQSQVAQLPTAEAEPPNLLRVIVLPPKGAAHESAEAASDQTAAPHKGFLSKLKSFFGGMFR